MNDCGSTDQISPKVGFSLKKLVVIYNEQIVKLYIVLITVVSYQIAKFYPNFGGVLSTTYHLQKSMDN